MARKAPDTSKLEYAYEMIEFDNAYSQNHDLKTDSSQNYKKARKRANARAGWGLFFTVLLGLVMFAFSGYMAYGLWAENEEITKIITDAIAETDADFPAKDMMYIFAIGVANILACFAFRRGSVKGFACFLYILALGGCIYWTYTGFKSFEDPMFITVAAYALLSFIALACATNKCPYFEEDSHKHNPRVWWRYFLLSLFNFGYIILAIIFGLLKLIVKLITRKKPSKTHVEYV